MFLFFSKIKKSEILEVAYSFQTSRFKFQIIHTSFISEFTEKPIVQGSVPIN